MGNELNELFNMEVEDLVEKTKTKTSERWNPTADKGKEGIYSAVVKFIAWHENPKKSIMKKWTCWLTDPLTDKGKYVDCPSSIGLKSPLQDIFWKLKNSESVAEQNLSKKFSRRQSFAAIVQVIKDVNDPDSVGKLMVWNFGVKIYNKIQEHLQPEIGEPQNPFDLFDGKPFHVKITKVAGFNNYDSSKFLEVKQPITIDGKVMQKTQEDMQQIIDYLKENSPDLKKYDYQEWDDEITEYVNNVILNTVPNGKMIEGITNINLMKTETSGVIETVDDPFADTVKTPKPKAKNKAKESEPVNNTGTDILGELDDIDISSGSFDDDLYGGI